MTTYFSGKVKCKKFEAADRRLLSCELSLAEPDIDTIFHILSRIQSEGSPTTPFKSSVFTMYKALRETIGNVGNLRGTLLKTKFKYIFNLREEGRMESVL